MILGVNVDHVATLRQARGGKDPEPVTAAAMALLGGADGITVHLREDRRHICDRDLWLLRELVQVELNLEMAATKEILKIAVKTVPDLVTLVPEKRQELTTEGGLDVKRGRAVLKQAVKVLHGSGIQVSFFINADPDDVEISQEIGADMVEIHTGVYSDSRGKKQEKELARVVRAVQKAVDIGLKSNAGHGLNYYNVSRIAELDSLRGLYIGHSIISRAVLVGIERAVREMKELMSAAQKSEGKYKQA